MSIHPGLLLLNELWLVPAALLTLAIVFFGLRLRTRRQKKRDLQFALEGAFPSVQLGRLSPDRAELVPAQRVCTVLVIDIFGFSRVAETHRPEEVFEFLRTIYRELSDTVHEFGGVVDKSLGDGMLGVFGWDGTGEKASHAQQAVQCALALQKRSAQRAMRSPAGTPIFPFRLGINTAVLVMGDLARYRRAELSVVGRGLELAKRLAASCEPFHCLISAATAEAIDKASLPNPPLRRLISAQHFEDLIDALELDPFGTENSALKQHAVNCYRKFARLERNEERIPAPEGSVTVDAGKHGGGYITDFSRSGISIRLPNFLAPGVLVDCSLRLPSGEVLAQVIGEVRWGRRLDDLTYLHGLMFKTSSDEQKDLLFAKLLKLTPEHAQILSFRHKARHEKKQRLSPPAKSGS